MYRALASTAWHARAPLRPLSSCSRRLPAALPIARSLTSTCRAPRQQQGPGLSEGDRQIPVVRYEELKRLTEAPTGETLLIDVREPAEVIQGSIPSSVNLPASELQEALDLDPALWQRKYSFRKPSKSQNIIFYCLAGVRAANAAREFQNKGYKHVSNYEGSYQDWLQREQRGSGGDDD